MKRIVSMLLAICSVVLLFTPVSAENGEIVIEAEDYQSATFSVPVERVSEFSGEYGIAMLAAPIEDNMYKINYTFNSDSEGAYLLSLRCHDLGQSWTTDFWVSMNDGEEVYISDVAKKTADFKSGVLGNALVKEYRACAFEVEKGENVLSVRIDKNDTRSQLDDKLGVWIDYFKLTEIPFGFERMTPNKVSGVFEAGDSAGYELAFYTKADREYSYSYRVTDFWGREAESGELKLPKGSKTMQLKLGMYGIGWYRLELLENGAEIGYAYFSIVPKQSARYKGETPFATDFASHYFAKNSRELDRQIKTAKLAGITYGRERASWATFGKQGQQSWEQHVLGNMPELKKAGFDTTLILETMNLFQKDSDSFKDLFAAYDFQQRLVKNADGTIDMIEIDNELDGQIGKITPDDYAAYLKAMFISNADTGGKMKMSMVSLCLDTDNLFNEGLRLNRAMDYTDIYNFHAHTTFTEKDKILGIRKNYVEENMEAKMKSTNRDIPFWLTEAGIYILLEDGRSELTVAQLKDQARYLTTATVEALSLGVDKVFWFIWPKYIENNQEMGTFDINGNPNAAYQAEAICSYMLGKGEYKGIIESSDINGHVFDNGKNDVVVLWTDAPQNYEIKTDKPVTVTDMMGQSSVMQPTDGKVCVDAAYYPIYVTLDGRLDESEYYPRKYSADTELKRKFTPAERIILQQTFEGKESADARSNGYELEDGKEEHMTLTVNNLNSEEKTVLLKGELDGYAVSLENAEVRVPAMSKAEVKVTLVPTEKTVFPDIGDIKRHLRFTAETDGGVSSPSVSAVRILNRKTVTPTFLMDGSENIKNYDISNVADGAVTNAEVQDDGSYRFGVQFAHSNCWYYPKLKIADPKKLADTDGVVFWVQGDDLDSGYGDIKLFADFSDGRRYYTGMASKYPIAPGWVQAKVAWDDFILFSSPYGAMDLRDFDPTLIDYIEIGGHFYDIDLSQEYAYYIKEPGFFTYSSRDDSQNRNVIFEIEQNGKYSAPELAETKIILPDNTETVSVMLTDEYTDKFRRDGNTVTADLSALEKGKYSLRVITENKDGTVISGRVDFYIN